jgi:signal transduction histidine kinase
MMKLPRTSLVWRLYAVGVAQLLLVAVAAIGIGIALARFPPHGDIQAAIARLKPLGDQPAELTKALAALRTHQSLLVSVYDADRKLVATNIEPPLLVPKWGPEAPDAKDQQGHELDATPRDFPLGPPPEPPRFGGPRMPPFFGHGHFGHPPGPHRGPPEIFMRFELGQREGILIARFEHPKPSLVPQLLTLVTGLLVVGLGAFFTTRWIARPLEHLSQAASALGRGELHARAHLQRGDELGEVGRAFNEMADRIQHLLLAEKELLANVAHELRTPLARIHVALEIATEGDAEAVRTFLAEIAVDLSELEVLIDDVLTATRFELTDGKLPAAGFALHREPIAPELLGRRSVERFRARHPEQKLELELEPELPLVDADPVLFRRVLDNLLENAHKYSLEGDRHIELRLTRREGAVCFEVQDHGLGISAEDLPRVFDAFFRGERSRSRDTGGVGLGLTLAKRIVEAHGGTIDVTSSPGAGTCVRVALPA